MSGPDAADERFPLRGRRKDVVLEADGVRHPRTSRGRGRAFTRYDEITHLALSERFVWIGERRALTVLSRRLFLDPDGGPRLLRALVEAIGERPGGQQQLARMREIDAWGRRAGRPVVARVLAVVCGVAFLLELLYPSVATVAGFSPVLFADGDWWRLITGNLLHGSPLHLLMNLVGLLVLGRLVERALGPLRTICIATASGVAAMAVSGLWVGGVVLGVSGVVFGLFGAVLWVELRCADQLPAWWRFPRTLMWVVWAAFLVDVALGFAVPFIAGEAHLGGFAGGLGMTALLTRRRSLQAPVGPAVRNAAALCTALLVVAIGAATGAVLGPDDYRAAHAARLARLPSVSPDELNNHAWLIAIDPKATHAQLEAALLLAQRAVKETDGEESTILDTLAEVQFQLGHSDEAVTTIDAAIERAPNDRYYKYYREQRRRFTGERAADDRPPDPVLPPLWRREEPQPASEDGLTV